MGGGVTRREFGLRPCLACCLNAHFLSKLVDAKQTLNFLVILGKIEFSDLGIKSRILGKARELKQTIRTI